MTVFLKRLWCARDNIRPANIRAKNLKYMLIFALAPVLANIQGTFFESDLGLLGLDVMTLMGGAYCIGAGVIFAFSRVESMAGVARVSVVLMLAGFIPWLFLPESQLSLGLAVLFMFGFGGCAACAAFAFTFALNNAERFFGAALISVFCILMQLGCGLSLLPGLLDSACPALLVLGTVLCLWSYKTEDFTDADKKNEARLNPAVKLMLYFFMAYKLVEILYAYFPAAAAFEGLILNGLAGILAIGLSFGLRAWAKHSIWMMCNLFFIAMICVCTLFFTPAGSIGHAAGRVFCGFQQMGFIASYYLLGGIFKKHGNFRLFKRSLVILLPGSLFLHLISGALAALLPEQTVLISAVITGLIFIVFILLSPLYAEYIFYADRSDDFQLADMPETQEETEPAGSFESLGLTQREKEVTACLLRGLSMRQVSGELKIKFDTVKFHVKNIYKKLGIGSKVELFVRFGVVSPDSEDSAAFGNERLFFEDERP